MMKPIIFISIDSVLCTLMGTDYWYRTTNQVSDQDGALFCPEASENLNRLCEQFDADVVVVSTWFDNKNLDQIRAFMKRRGFNLNIIDSIKSCGNRGLQIKSRIGKSNRPYLIISSQMHTDDLLRIISKKNYVECCYQVGFADKKIHKRAVSIIRRSLREEVEEKTNLF